MFLEEFSHMNKDGFPRVPSLVVHSWLTAIRHSSKGQSTKQSSQNQCWWMKTMRTGQKEAWGDSNRKGQHQGHSTMT